MFVTLLLSLTAAPAPVVQPNGNWPVFRGNAEMTGTADIKLPDQLEEHWKFKTGNAIEGAPAIVDGVVYVASADKHLYALNLKDGTQKWKTPLESPLKASPAVKKDRVYIGNSDGKFFCLHTADGKIDWSVELNGEITAGANFHENNILIGTQNNTLFCLDIAGKQVWEFKIEGPVNGAVAVVGDRTFLAGCDSLLHVIDAKTGKSQGNTDLGGQSGATAAVLGDSVYAGTMSNQVLAVNWKAIKKEWQFDPPLDANAFYSSASVTDKVVVVGSRDKKIYCLDRATGRERWSYITEGVVDTSPLIVGNRVYCGCGSADSLFYVLDLKNGRLIQKLEFDRTVTGSPAAGPDCILIGTEKGTLYCLGAKP